MAQVNSQSQSKSKCPIQNTYTGCDDGSFRSEKLIKTLLDPSIFIDRKDLSIDQ